MRYSFPEGTPRGEDGDTEGISECVVADCEGSGEDAKYEEWLRRSLWGNMGKRDTWVGRREKA
jgi:hypothetical protein